MQSSAVIARSNIVRYYVNGYRNWSSRISIGWWIRKRHPIPRPNGWAMRCLCEYLWKNDCVITALQCMYAGLSLPNNDIVSGMFAEHNYEIIGCIVHLRNFQYVSLICNVMIYLQAIVTSNYAILHKDIPWWLDRWLVTNSILGILIYVELTIHKGYSPTCTHYENVYVPEQGNHSSLSLNPGWPFLSVHSIGRLALSLIQLIIQVSSLITNIKSIHISEYDLML